MYSIGLVALIVACLSNTYALPPCVCTRESRPVCGSNGVTYSNKCLLNCAASTDPSVRIVKTGPCEKELGGNCICTFEYSPVCGTDGSTYPNQCALRCQQTKLPSLAISYRGACRNVRQVADACACTRMLEPVCGSDGVTYSNTCMLQCAKKRNPDLKVLYRNSCEEPREERVERSCACGRNLAPVCASNGKTYSNKCMMKCAGNNLTVKSPGLCDES